MMKKVKYFSISIFSFFLILTFVKAETYTVVGDVEKVSWETSDDGANSWAPRVTLQDEKGNKITAWCKDAYATGVFENEDGTPVTYTTKNVSSDAKAMYQSIFDNTCGDEQTQAAAIRAGAIDIMDYNGTGSASAAERYEGLINGKVTFGDTDASAEKFKDVLANAQGAYETSGSSGAKVTQIGSTTYMVESDEDINNPYCEKRSEGTWYCDIKDYCTNPGDSFDLGIGDGSGIEDLIEGTDSNGNPTECLPCEVQVFQTDVGGVVQELIACVDSNGNSRGEGGTTKTPTGSDADLDDYTGEEYSDVTELLCPDVPFEDECLPYSTIATNSSAGTEYCDEDGKTVISIDEYVEEEEIGDIYNCLADGVDYGFTTIDATEAVLGDNKFCNVYCTEDYELVLPGPTAKTGDDSVMVNAGTFFTIEKAITSTTSLTCIAEPDYKSLVDEINILRDDLAEAVTKLSYANSGSEIEDGYLPDVNTYEWCDDDNDPSTPMVTCGIEYTTYTYWWNAPSVDAWDFNEAGSDGGNYYKTLETFGDTCSSRVSREAAKNDCQSSSDYTKLVSAVSNKSVLQNAVETAQDNLNPELSKEKSLLRAYLDDWDECFNWELKALGDKWKTTPECNTEISFDYYDSFAVDQTNKKIEIVMDQTKSEFEEDASVSKIDQDIKNVKSGSCTLNASGDYNCDNNTTEEVEYGSYSYKDATLNLEYEFKNKICNPYDENTTPYVVDDESECTNGSVFEGFPVSINTPRGQYWYQYYYSGLGHNYDENCSTGRLELVLNKWDSNITYDSYKNKCVYGVNNCSNCNVGCVSPSDSCDITWGCSNRCKISCVGGGCILDFNTGFLATYRTISLNEPFTIAYSSELDPLNLLAFELSPLALFPESDSDSKVSSTNDFSSNWDTNKANKVKDEIYDSATGGENIYEKTPEYVFELTPQTITEIKEYNENHPYSQRKDGEDGTYHNVGGYARWESNFVTKYAIDGRDNAINSSYSGYENESFTGPALK